MTGRASSSSSSNTTSHAGPSLAPIAATSPARTLNLAKLAWPLTLIFGGCVLNNVALEVIVT